MKGNRSGLRITSADRLASMLVSTSRREGVQDNLRFPLQIDPFNVGRHGCPVIGGYEMRRPVVPFLILGIGLLAAGCAGWVRITSDGA